MILSVKSAMGIEVGVRLNHPERGPGIVVEIMEDGRTRVRFDSGEEHRYKPSSLTKLTLVRRAQLTGRELSARGPSTARCNASEAKSSTHDEGSALHARVQADTAGFYAAVERRLPAMRRARASQVN